ncbi:CPBP family intramembrane glutamic endopeptidase [Daejeonella sp. H1SJ63]|uniref:CPBP family intramembrane glutamic endopeptidase n=1 Tax=Daejeonella sp. H1SJ63 TaxID=3034145 RepID=UPI0023EE083C|nr:CPBP family intramembrane glutamic endopeptidase [Daejeonella sp. H1SJ63]
MSTKRLISFEPPSFIQRLNTFKLLLIVLLANLILSSVFAILRQKYGYSMDPKMLNFDSVLEEFIVVVVVAPVFETVVFQYFMITLMLFLAQRFFKRDLAAFAIILPAICFGFSHTYNNLYVLNTFLAALMINYFYILVKSRNQNAFILTVILHALYNFSVFGLKQMA